MPQRFCPPLTRLLAPLLTSVVLIPLLGGCVVNPVTGKNEIGFISTEKQIEIGKANYVPAQQMQGGLYAVDPDLSAYVAGIGNKLSAQVEGTPLPYEFVVLNNSVPNAWAMPGGKIAINRGLLTELTSEAELGAVLGHEIVHAAARHGAKGMERGMLLQGVLVAAAIGTRNQEYAGAMLGGAQVAAGLVTQKFGRDAERQSDQYGTRYLAKAGYDPQAAVTLQETFVRLSEGRRTGWLEGLFASHPASRERVENNKALVALLRTEGFTGGELGADRYQRAVAQIRRDAPAYAAADAARKAVQEKNLDAAITQVDKAIALQPREAQFYGLKGDIRRLQERHADAVRHYGDALARDDAYFSYYLGRGVSRLELKERANAKADLNASIKLLPTAVAYNQLGRIAEADGNQDEAIRYYAAAAKAQDATGQAAFASLVRLDLPRQPARYIEAQLQTDGVGRLVLRVNNPTPANAAGVKVRVSLRWASAGDDVFDVEIGKLVAGASVAREIPLRDDQLLSGEATAVAARVL
jgi:predicted Zn-dependent protease